ncbi:purine nucleoside phosphorylase-like [Cylas formicarius]|uniref:purine nucleoside phosphorylase-like n=1 Tax=Cylas formicarius TaxID=197179 RepID=UPI002958A89E|nr:purine nucleoside phosphorylase-like [Cylas formicarius]
MSEKDFDLEYLSKSYHYIRDRIPIAPKILIICGSGLGALAETLRHPLSILYKDVPNFPQTTVEGHEGKLVFGELSSVNVVCMLGRPHYYEGYSLKQIAIPVRVMKLLGVETLFVTNAAGGVNPSYKVGDIMVIKDHINFLTLGGQNPLRGKNDPNFGPRFFAANRAYDKALIATARQVARELKLAHVYHEGVYAIYSGPNYETVAEIKMLRMLGVDATGMSTIPEVLVAKHCDMTVFGISLITNKCIASYDVEDEPNHEEVLRAVTQSSERLKQFVSGIVAKGPCGCKNERA